MTIILDTFDSPQRNRSLHDIAVLTGLPRSTAHRILDQLVELGWVERSVTGYQLGWRASHLSSRANEDSRLRVEAAPHIHELAVQSQLIVHLAVLDGTVIRYLDKVGGATARNVPTRVGGSAPAYTTAVGKAMLAYVDAESLDTILERGPSIDPSLSPFSLHRDLAAVRMRGGLAKHRSTRLTGVSCVGAPIFDNEERIVGGISLCDAGTGAPLDRFAPMLLQRAHRISLQLSSGQAGVSAGRPHATCDLMPQQSTAVAT
ncbi:IclR family transcriptional regulator [Rhodococcus sp. NPDC003318]|uniref:IclR family transcriptional regulator n=1 Tax=Rhodococcus sp. NPDC003318 TaxID=3364503 RepID=UPI0036BABC20